MLIENCVDAINKEIWNNHIQKCTQNASGQDFSKLREPVKDCIRDSYLI